MPKVTIKATPSPGVPGRWVLGAGIRQKLNPDGSAQKDPNGNALYWPARSGVFIPSGEDTELVITDEELKDLQNGANASFFAVIVTDESAQPAVNEGGSSMATQPINQPPQPPPPTPPPPTPPAPAPGTTVPPGTSAPSPTPTPTPAPAPAPTPAPDTTKTAKK